MTSLTDWDSVKFLKTFFVKDCTRFIANKLVEGADGSSQVCGCGGTRNEHKLIESDPTVEWSEKFFRKQQTNAFGKIRFTNPSDSFYRKPAKFVRLSDESDVRAVIKLMIYHWRMNDPSPPDLIISVFGGGKQFYLGNKRSTEIFNHGLAKAIVATNGWIFTFGCNFGVARAVGEAVRDHQRFDFDQYGRVKCSIQCVGVAPWGTVKNRECLINPFANETSFSVRTYHSDNTVRPGKPTSLEPNHTHFLLVDDGYRGKEIGTAELRAKLEKELSRPSDGRTPIPVVGLLVEGGVMAVDNVVQSLTQDLPVVICEGSGRAADMIARCYHQLSGNSKPSEERLIESVAKQLQTMQASWRSRDEMIQALAKTIVKLCTEKRDLIHVFNLSRAEDLDVAILQSLMQSKRLDTIGQLRLALNWNRDDIARDKILARSETTREHIRHRDLKPFFIDAVIRNQVQFVRLFCESGFNVAKHLTVGTLRFIYQQTIEENPSLKEIILRFTPAVTAAELTLSAIHTFLTKLTRRFSDFKYYADKVDGENKETFSCPYTELFLHSVILGRQELALFFWELCENPILNAVVGTVMTNILSGLIPETETLDYSTLKCKLQEVAVGLLNEAHSAHAIRTEKLISIKYPKWGNLTVVDLAALANDQEFLATVCCQHSIISTWKDNIVAGGLTVTICAFTLVPIPWLIWFQDPPTFEARRSRRPSSKLKDSKVKEMPLIDRHERGSLTPWTPPPNPEAFEREFQMSRRMSSRITVANETLLDLTPKQPTPLMKIWRFYNTPVVKFACHTLWYIVFLLLYAYVLLFSFRWHATVPEIVMHICVGSLLLEEIRLMSICEGITFQDKLVDWWYQSSLLSWTGLDILILLSGTSAFICRWFIPTFATAKLILVFNFILLLLRIFRVYFANSYLGPKIVMIKRMVWDVVMFLLVFIVFLLAYTISSQSLLYPYRSFYSMIFWDLFNHGMWELFGSIQDELTGVSEKMSLPECSSNMTISYECEIRWWPVPILLATYLIFANILLVNMLIAVFTHVFEDVQKNSQQIWKYQMYFLVKEFQSKPLFPPPFIILVHIYLLVKWVLLKFIKQSQKEHNVAAPKLMEMLSAFEKAIRSDYLDNQIKLNASQSENLLSTINQKLKKLEITVSDIESKAFETIGTL